MIQYNVIQFPVLSSRLSGSLGAVPVDLDFVRDHGALASRALVDKVGEHLDRVKGSACRLGVELDAPDALARLGRGDDALDRRVVAVDEERCPAVREVFGELQGVLVVLRLDHQRRSYTRLLKTYSDVNPTSFDASGAGQRQDRLVVTSVPECHAVGFETRGESENLVTHANTKDGLVPLVDRLPDAHRRVHDHLGVSGTVRQEQAVKAVSDSVKVVVPRKDSDDRVTLDEAAQDVGLASKVEYGDTGSAAVGVEGEWLFDGCLGDQVFLGRVPVFAVRRTCRRLIANGKATEGGSLVSEQRGDGSGVDAGKTGDVVSRTPLVQALDGLVVGVFKGDIGDDNTGTLDSVALKEGQSLGLRERVGRHAVVADHWRGEDKDLTAVRWVSHRVGVGCDRGAEDGLSKLGRLGSERGPGESLARFEVKRRGNLGRQHGLHEVDIHVGGDCRFRGGRGDKPLAHRGKLSEGSQNRHDVMGNVYDVFQEV